MKYWEDLPVGRVDNFGEKLVEREEVLDFARKFDPQAFHLDDAAAAANPMFGRLAASGFHTAGMTMRMVADYHTSEGGRAILGGAGLEELTWLKPVFPGDTLRVRTEVIEARLSKSKPDRGVVKTRTLVFNQDDEPVMRQVSVALVGRRPE